MAVPHRGEAKQLPAQTHKSYWKPSNIFSPLQTGHKGIQLWGKCPCSNSPVCSVNTQVPVAQGGTPVFISQSYSMCQVPSEFCKAPSERATRPKLFPLPQHSCCPCWSAGGGWRWGQSAAGTVSAGSGNRCLLAHISESTDSLSLQERKNTIHLVHFKMLWSHLLDMSRLRHETSLHQLCSNKGLIQKLSQIPWTVKKVFHFSVQVKNSHFTSGNSTYLHVSSTACKAAHVVFFTIKMGKILTCNWYDGINIADLTVWNVNS